MTEPTYIVGIDLGTTHNVLAYTVANLPEGQTPNIELLEIPQLVSMGEVEAKTLLPAFLFLPEAHDVAQGGLALPWDAEIDYAIGEFARNRGAELPARLVSSAKSWLCHTGVDRTQAILPWDAPADARKVSPLETMTRYLRHMREAWNYMMAGDEPALMLENQTIYLTVPASFDAMARELTVQAAQAAGLQNFTLLEEPQAAFYAWLAAQDDWREQISVGESVLVCDVGGGTTDFSLIQVTEEEGNARPATRGRRRSHPARRRQHGPDAGLRRARQAGPAGHPTRQLAVPGAVALLSPGQRAAAQRPDA